MSFEFDMFFCIHLPGVVRRDRPRLADSGSSPRWGRGKVGLMEPALEGAIGGDRPVGNLLQQMDPDECGPPSRMRAAEGECGVENIGGRRRYGGPVFRRECLRPTQSNPSKQSVDRRDGEVECLGDLSDLVPVMGKPKHRLANRLRDGTWHELTSD
jgi:hypothetical protein